MGTCIILHLRSHMVTLIYRFPFSNYLREEIDERFDLLDLNRLACQEEVLAHLSKPGVAFLATGLLELHEVDAFWYFRFEDELCPLDI